MINIDGEPISRERLMQVAKILVPDMPLERVSSITLEAGVAVVEVYALDDQGSKYVDTDGSMAMHRITRRVL